MRNPIAHDAIRMIITIYSGICKKCHRLPWVCALHVMVRSCGYSPALAWSSPLTQSSFPMTSHLEHSNSDVCLFVLRWSLALSPSTSLYLLPLSLYINTLTPDSPLLLSSHNKPSTPLLHYTSFKPNQPTTPTLKMSAPNANNPNEGIIGQAVNSVKNAANYVSETVQGQSAEASKEGNKQQAKGNVPGQDSITDRASGALNAAGDKINQEKHEGSAEANKRSI